MWIEDKGKIQGVSPLRRAMSCAASVEMTFVWVDRKISQFPDRI